MIFSAQMAFSRFTTALMIAFSVLTTSACQSSPPSQPLAAPAPKTPKVALVLGGGAAKGIAHVGVIKALEDNGIKPDIIVGTSMGSLVGSLYASGMSADQLKKVTIATPDSALMDFTFSNQGFVEGIKLKNFINKQVNNRPIEAFPIKFAAIATERDTLAKTVLDFGDAGLAVQASCSVPNLFIAPRIPEKVGKKYIDGGVSSLVPVDSARDLGADIVIAVDVTAAKPPTETQAQLAKLKNAQPIDIKSLASFWGLFEQSIASGLYRPLQNGAAIDKNINKAAVNRANATAATNAPITREALRADVLIIPEVGQTSFVDTRERAALIHEGEKATLAKLSDIQKLIANYPKTMP